jgi:hypothetical protein
MKRLVLFFITAIFSLNCYSQITFEKGYFITNSNEKVNCLIKNSDWRSNPSEFQYKLTEDSDKITVTIESVKEFGVYNALKYERHIVKIDKSSNDIGLMSKVKKPIYEEQKLFLKVLVEGEAKLYLFRVGNLNRFFYSKDSSEVAQLIFKRYLTTDNKVGENNWYKQQLWSGLACSSFTLRKIKTVDYVESELVNFFIDYNSCNSNELVNFTEEPKTDVFNLSIRPNFRTTAIAVINPAVGLNTIDNYDGLRFHLGIEAEFILPFMKKKWSILIEPTYQYFNYKNEIRNKSVAVDYSSIEVPIGIRYHIFLNEHSKVFLNSSFVRTFDFNSTIKIDSNSGIKYNLDIRSGTNFAFGFGYKYNDRYGFELRYQTYRDILINYADWDSYYDSFSIILIYSLF